MSVTSKGKDGENQTASNPENESVEKKTESILDVKNAVSYCQSQVKKFDFYSFAAGQFMPANTRPHYYSVHALFLEVLKSREVSKEQSICKTRLDWWLHILDDIVNNRKTREPISIAL